MIAIVNRPTTASPTENEKFQTETFPARETNPPKRHSTEAPAASWTLADLTLSAKREHQRIDDSQSRVVPHYWRLGTALNLVRQKKKFARGQWEQWLALDKAAGRKTTATARLRHKLGRRLRNLAISIVQTADESADLGDARGDLLAHADRLAQALEYLRHACAKHGPHRPKSKIV